MGLFRDFSIWIRWCWFFDGFLWKNKWAKIWEGWVKGKARHKSPKGPKNGLKIWKKSRSSPGFAPRVLDCTSAHIIFFHLTNFSWRPTPYLHSLGWPPYKMAFFLWIAPHCPKTHFREKLSMTNPHYFYLPNIFFLGARPLSPLLKGVTIQKLVKNSHFL